MVYINKNGIYFRAMENGVIIDGQNTNNGFLLDRTDNTTIDGNGTNMKIVNYTYNAKAIPEDWPEITGGIRGYSADRTTIRDVILQNSFNAHGDYHSKSCAPGALMGDQEWGVFDIFLYSSSHSLIENVSAIGNSDANIVFGNSDNVTLRNSTLKNGRWYVLQFLDSDNALVEKNYLYSNYQKPDESLHYPGCTIMHQFIYRHREGVGSTIRYNIIDARDSKAYEPLLFYDANGDNFNENHLVHNNILLAGPNQRGALTFYADIEGIVVKNNILVHPSHAVNFGGDQSRGIVFEHNLYDASTAYYMENGFSFTFTDINNLKKTDAEIGEIKADPIPTFYLFQSSPARDRGVTIDGYNGTDYYGEKVPIGPGVDIGAVEYTTDKMADNSDNIPPLPPILITID